ncbi:MAG: lysoplasmalogenase [Chloracidobacterium sp.]
MLVVWRFWIGYGLLAAAYLVTLGYRPYPGSFLVKALPVLFATGWVYGWARARTWQVSCGLAWSAVGDVFLALDDRFFFFGLGAFFLAHLCYIAGFAPLARIHQRAALRAGSVLGYGLGLGWVLGQATGWQLPILAYALVLTGMGVAAALRQGSHLVFLGAVAFIISDSLLAINRFLLPLPLEHMLVMVTYYLAQGLISSGILSDHAERPTP